MGRGVKLLSDRRLNKNRGLRIIDDTIGAIATPLGQGGLGVVRISGPEALPIAAKIFRSSIPLTRVPTHTVHYGKLVEGDELVDQALATVFRSPQSYTGEDVVEFSCHGGIYLLKRILNLCVKSGARLAEPGEFTKRAFLNGKMDLAQAEAVADLIAAQSESFRRCAMEQLNGRLSTYLKSLRGRLLDFLAHLEGNLDFMEEEVPALSQEAMVKQLDRLMEDTQRLLETASQGRLMREGLRVVLVGKPNVGKSSLFNALLNNDRAIVTEVPGTTRDTLEERLVMEEIPVVLTDCAGLRANPKRVESEGIHRARRALDAADVVLFVMDASQPVTSQDAEVVPFLAGKRSVWVLNKIDRLSGKKPFPLEFFHPLFEKRGNGAPVPLMTSAHTGEGLKALRQAVVKQVVSSKAHGAEAQPVPTLINVRHGSLLRDALTSLQSARAGVDRKSAEECVAIDLRQALGGFNQITGEGVTDEVINAVFSKFCIGK